MKRKCLELGMKKIQVLREKVDSQGYRSNGQYRGIGHKLWKINITWNSLDYSESFVFAESANAAIESFIKDSWGWSRMFKIQSKILENGNIDFLKDLDVHGKFTAKNITDILCNRT